MRAERVVTPTVLIALGATGAPPPVSTLTAADELSTKATSWCTGTCRLPSGSVATSQAAMVERTTWSREASDPCRGPCGRSAARASEMCRVDPLPQC